MSIYLTTNEQGKQDQFRILKEKIKASKTQKLSGRIAANPFPTDLEYFLCAFMEMYEPHIQPFVSQLYEKGYIVEVSSGFCGEYGECQAINGYFVINDGTQAALERMHVKVKTDNSGKSIKFWPKEADLYEISDMYQHIVSVLPDKQRPLLCSMSLEMSQFRMTYIPANPTLKALRLFECLQSTIYERMALNIKDRLSTKPYLQDIESRLGTLVEMLEPQVRDAVLELNRKGYSTDMSGFMSKADCQMITGDFTIDEESKKKLEKVGVEVETNPSNYTRLRFWPKEADIKQIKKQWDMIVNLLPDKGYAAQPSMTKKSREFREKYKEVI